MITKHARPLAFTVALLAATLIGCTQSSDSPSGLPPELTPPTTARGTAQQFALALAQGRPEVACGLADDRFRGIGRGFPCPEALAELAVDDRYVFTQPDCVSSAANYEEEEHRKADSVKVSIDCPKGYTWLVLTQADGVWQISDINARK
ncbi:hypothetical protein GCM10010497_59400 [Streptomyces cinereoruber]|uniref:Lipoprotein n=1 Tax=Streptomyces cinereoruber TaxID=67260 RepID=A0AAV4KSV4_9ACTN|nr:hypothetical protein [Streptomyces cinereoruber]MBB4161713.1 hypothetical protein [Streptomyces cinereoruber]MBY8820032.1 hypothetical protein [Streptomyces cinereoruber]NIH65398.1 hypothetical protein [Streptomyces cinereoruber]QEV30870.1 hypothetical protein CP977_00495 [Streptomyces cinereoruber]GGR48143.1 hypothetical protein GCM10010497_59400 [Streptomyces cinereoruber]